MPLDAIYVVVFSLAGAVLGSFFNVCIYRIPRGESIVFPSSHCTSCSHKLGPADLVPVISWILLKGKCRYCKSGISFRYPAVELLTGLIFAVTYLVFGLSLETLFHIIFASLLILITFIDIDHRIIPDRFIIAGILLAIVRFFAINDLTWYEAAIGAAAGGGVLLLVDLAGRIFYKIGRASCRERV